MKIEKTPIAANHIGVFCRPFVIGDECDMRTERYPETDINKDYVKPKYSQAFGEILSWYRHLSKTINLQPYRPQKDFRSSRRINLCILHNC